MRGWKASAVPLALAAILAALPEAGRAVRSASPVQVSVAGQVRVVTPALLGLNGVDTTGPRWDDGSFDAVLKQFAPGVLRYPGGTAANYWSWRDGWFQPGTWPAEPSRPVDDKLAVFAAGLRAAGAVPLFDLNTVTYHGVIGSAATNLAMLHTQLRFLRAAAAAGLPVRMVELGNELYLNGVRNKPPGPDNQDYLKRFPTAAGYARQMNAWIARVHRAFPGVQIAAVATDANDVTDISHRRLTWNSGVLPRLRGEDAVTIHENLRVFNPGAGAATVLAQPYLHFERLEAYELSLFRAYHLPAWVTEFNMADMTTAHVFQGTWLHGLYVAEEALQFLSDPEITYAGLNATVGTAASAPIFASSRGFGKGGPPTVPLALSAAGTTLSMIQGALRRAASAQPLSFSPVPRLGTTQAPALQGEELSTNSGPELIMVNLSSQPVTLDLPGIFPAGFAATQISAPAVSTLVTGPDSTITKSSSGESLLRLLPYAIADAGSANAGPPRDSRVIRGRLPLR